jgi:opacity protein-like surface antigen
MHMRQSFRRFYTLVVAGILLLALSGSSALAEDGCASAPAGRGIYVGVFGGGGWSSLSNVTQLGTALYPESAGGPLGVHATGSSGNRGVGLVGVQIGHEWSDASNESDWGLLPAVEMEGYYLTGTQRADLNNPTTRLPEHEFVDTFPMDNAVFLTNLVLSLRTPSSRLTPYIGGGIGAACVSISGADSSQVKPPEPGINHFNSGPSTSSWGFAAQAKVGLRIALSERVYLFTEYRYLYVGSTTDIFGSTVYPTHVPTTDWTVHFNGMSQHMAVGGICFSF